MPVRYKTTVAAQYQKDFISYVREQAIYQGWQQDNNTSQHYYMDCTFYFPHEGMDANNYFKCMADAITDAKCVWIDDTQLCERVQGIFYDSANPRIEIKISPVTYTGIFPSSDELDKFERRCETCVRYARNCSLLAQAKRGHICSEICGGVCAKHHEPKTKRKEK